MRFSRPDTGGVVIVMENTDNERTLALIRPGDIGVMSCAPQHNPPHHDYYAWRDFIADWDIELPIPFLMTVKRNAMMCCLSILSRMPDSREQFDHSKVMELAVDTMLPTIRPCEASHRWVRALLRWFLVHELDEFIHVGGHRPFDPHANGKKPTPENS